jgi:hypothetical protein
VFVHSVYFWLKDELTWEQRARFWQGVNSLARIGTVRQAYVGRPAPTDRPVIDSSYTCALILAFDDQAGHDLYQTDPVHDRFRDECSPFWSRVLIYDALAE